MVLNFCDNINFHTDKAFLATMLELVEGKVTNSDHLLPTVCTYFTLQVLHYYLTFSFHLKLALLTQLPASNERKIPPHLKIKPVINHNWGFIQDLFMHI